MAQHDARSILKSIELEHIGDKRPAFCSGYEIFAAQIIRASMVRGGKIAIITPSEFLLEINTLELTRYLKSRLKIRHEIIIFDLVNYKFKYENRGVQCLIRR